MARARGAGAGCALLLVAAGCGGVGAGGLEVARRIALPDSAFASLHVDSAGRAWLGRPGGMLVLSAVGEVAAAPVELGRGVPRVVGEAGGRVYARSGERVWVLDRGTARVRAERGGMGGSVLLPDARGRYLYQGTPSGAVLAHHPGSLEPLWAWAALGAPTTALAASPEGDRVYQALAGREGGGVVLTRDQQTGRILAEERFAAPVRALAATAEGDLLAVIGQGERSAVLSLRPREGELRLRWRHAAEWAGEGPISLRHAPGSDRLVVAGGANGGGLRVLDAEAGTVLGSEGEAPRDAAVGPDGRVYLLGGGEVRVVRGGAG